MHIAAGDEIALQQVEEKFHGFSFRAIFGTLVKSRCAMCIVYFG